MKRYRILVFAVAVVGLFGATGTRSEPKDGGFSDYILRTVKKLAKERAGGGYGNFSYTQDLTFGDNGILKATHPPLTMCVAAQMEILVEALNLYAQETHDFSPFHFVPKSTWERLRPLDLRGQIWTVTGSPSKGAADAFQNFGMGERIPFKELFPGAFLNFNRTKSGHGVIFLGFIDQSGADMPAFSDHVAGFKYFSSQGKDSPDGGFGYRWAFFSDAGCPTLPPGKKRDCGVIRSEANNYLVGGYMKTPKMWDREKAASQILSSREATDPALTREGEFDSNYFTGVTTDD
jgi:hypothetical protein